MCMSSEDAVMFLNFSFSQSITFNEILQNIIHENKFYKAVESHKIVSQYVHIYEADETQWHQ
jgi:hypothetical protein